MIDIQKFGPDFKNGTSWNNTWVRPAFTPYLVVVYLCGGGGGGGSGSCGSTANNGCGGGGGAGGELIYFECDPRSLGTVESVVIGDGGAGGAGRTGNNVGAIGTDGSPSVFASVFTARGGPAHPTAAPKTSANLAATTFPPSGNKPGGNASAGANNAADSPRAVFVTQGIGPMGYLSPGAGGGGGGGTSAVGYAGGSGVPNNVFINSTIADNNGAGSGGTPGNAVELLPASLIPVWAGGGGSGGVASGTSPAGGIGKFGSGGGGSGGHYNFSAGTGDGGKGGAGFCVVISYG